MKYIIIIVSIFTLLNLCTCQRSKTYRLHKTKIITQEEKLIYSNVLEEKVKVLKTNIGELKSKDSINLLVLLDGDEYFGFASDILTLYYEDGRINPTILVGLPSTMKSRWKYYTPTKAEPYENSDEETRKLFEYSGAFDKYGDFVKIEIVEAIENKLSVEFDNKIIFGHSMGGLGALNFLLFKEDMFDNYIIASPSVIWDNYVLLDKLESETESGGVLYNFENLSLSTAENDIEYYTDGVEYLIEFLDVLSNTNESKITNIIYPNETHMTIGLRSLYDGILEIMIK